MDNYAYVRGQETDKAGMSAATAGHPADPGAASNPYEKLYHYDDDDYYDPHCFFSSGLAQNRKRLGFIATCSTVQCKDAGSAGYDPLLPFKEDLAEWLYKMIRAEIQPNRFFPELQSGVHLCKLGIHMQRMAVKYRKEHPEDTSLVPSKPPSLKYANATRKSPPFYCRDNISNFLDWSIEFGVKHSCRFETDDLTLRKNDRQIILHLMEVGRLGVRHGIEPPTLIKIEMELEEPLPEPEPEPEPEPTPEEPKPKPKKGVSFLDEQVQACAAECNCSIPFTVNRVSEGRYKILNKTQVGEGRSIVFVRVLRSHVMVRVGGGWETLSAYFSKMDPCRAPMDSFGGKSPTGKLKQRFESNEEEQPAPRREPTPQREPEREVEEDSAPAPVVSETYAPVPAAVPPAKPKRPATSPSPAAIAATADPMRKATPPRTRSPTKSPLRPSASTPAPRAASPKKTPVRASPSVSRESLISPTPRPNSIREPIITPRQTKASLLRTSSPSAIKTPSPANPLSPTGSGPGGISHPPWKNVPNSRSNLSRSASTPQRPASRTSGEAGPSTPNFQQPNRASTLDRKEPPTQNKRLIPVGGKNLPKSDQYNRATQRVSGKPKITSPELIRRAMEIMKDNGEVEDEEKVVRSPTDPALIAAIEEIAEEQYQCEAGEAVDVDVENLPEAGEPGPLPEPSVPIPEPSVTDLAPDSGVDTLAESKPAKVTENATVGDSSVPHLSGGDTLQDISDMITDDQDRSEMDQLEELPSDDAGFDVQDIPSQELVIEPIGLYYEDDATEEFEPTIEAGSVTEVASEAPLPFELISQPEAEPQVTEPEAEPQVVKAETQPETEPLARASAEPADSDYEGGTTEDELNEAVGADNYASKMGEARHDSLSSANSGQVTGKDIPVDGPQRDGNVFVAVTISSQYPAEHRLAVTHEVDVDISEDGEKETTVEFLDPSELLGSITERHEPEEGKEEEEVTELLLPTEEIEEEELEEEDLVEQGQEDEEQWEDELDEVEEAEDAEKHIYVADVESGYDVSEQLQAMNEVELAISEGEELEDEPTPVITESMIKRMEEYMRAKSEVEDSIEEFEKNVKAEAVDDEQEESGEVLEVDNIDNLEEEPIEEPKAEVYNVDNLEEEPEKKLKAEVENIDDLEEEPFKELKAEINKVDDIEEEPVEESKVEASKVDNLEEESVELEPKVETDKVDNIEKEQAASLLEVTRRLEVLESITKRQLQLESAKEDLEESIKEFQRTTSKSDEDREPVLEVVDLEPVAEEPSAEAFPAAVSEDITVVGTLPGPIMIEEGSASSGTASPPTVIAEKVEPETSSFAEKVKRLEHMIKKHPMKVPRPSDESDQGVVEVDNIAVKDIFTELPTVLMEEIQPVKSTVSNIEKKEKDDLPPPLKPIGDQYEDFEPSKLEDVLAESMEHIPAPIDETFLVEEVIEVKPMAEELVVELSEAQKEPVAEETIVVPAKVPIAPVEAEKTVVEAEDQPELQHVKMSKPPEKVEEVVVKEQFKEASPPPKAIEVEPKDDLEIEDLEVIQEAEADEEGAIAEHPLSEGEEVVMKPEKTPLPNNSTLNLAPRRYSFEAEKSEEEKEGPARSSKRSMNSSGHTSDSDRSTSSEKDTSSGYHEDYETSDGDELGTSYDKVPDVIMEQDQHTRSILKGSVRESTDSGIASGKQSLSSTPSLPTKQRMKSEDDDVFEEERAKGLNLPTEGHVREAVFTKAIESAIKPLAWGIQIPNMGELQSASIVLPSKKAIRKASDGEYDYHGRRNNLQKVISKPHTEKTDMEWDERDQARHQDKMDGQTRDEKVHKWSGTLRSSQKKKKPFRTKKYDEDDILNAISQQATAVRAKNTCPVHNAGPPVTGPPKRRPAQRPGTAPARKSAPTSRPATARPTYAAAAASNPKTTNVKAAKVETRRPSSSSVPASRPVERGSKAIAVKPASRTSNPQEVKSLSTGPKSGPMNPGTSKPVLQTTKSTPIRRTGSLREGERAPLKLSNSLPRDKIRHGPKCTDLP
ncbi:microtubule-associated protein futsch-like isoform X4 [Bolinopsis microptera]|uniref:microtubule-associated protein futsch-like isoform X4 n=1 Tax=Bolinopsis microptera TaxID=2820187 RepID=UPI003079ACA3